MFAPHRGAKIQETNNLLVSYIEVVFDESIATNNLSDIWANEPVFGPVFQALTSEWIALLNDSREEVAEYRKLSLMYSNVILELILKSVALTSTITPAKNLGKIANMLPRSLQQSDEEQLEKLVSLLLTCTMNAMDGLIIRKELNRSIVNFLLKLFLVARNLAPALLIRQAVAKTIEAKDANILIHMTFPFLRMLVDFEYFVYINNVHQPEMHGDKSIPNAWLAQLLFKTLLDIVDEQKEDKIQLEAISIMRRMFVVQSNSPLHQCGGEQEKIALMYLPVLHYVLPFTTPGKLLCLHSEDDGSKDILKRELLVSIASLLSNLPNNQLKWYNFFINSKKKIVYSFVFLQVLEKIDFGFCFK